MFENYSGVYPRNEMRPRVLVSVLVLALSAANSNGSLMCAAYCMSSAPIRSVEVHHHQMQPNSSTVQAHTHHRGTPCAECPSALGSSLIQTPRCTSSPEVQALNEGSFTLRAPNGTHAVADDTLAPRVVIAFDTERSSVFGTASPPINIYSSAALPLRI